MNRFKMKKQGRNGEILIYDLIGEDLFGGVSSKALYEDLQTMGRLDTLTIRINSEGGDLREGWAMYNHIRAADVRNRVVIVDSLAASAASLVALAGDVRQIAKNAWTMIHNPQTFTIGDYRDHEKQTQLLVAVTEQVRNVYADRTGQDAAKLASMMDETTWLDAEQSRDMGFATDLIDAQPIAANIDISRWVNVPDALLKKANPNVIPARIASMARRLDTMRKRG